MNCKRTFCRSNILHLCTIQTGLCSFVIFVETLWVLISAKGPPYTNYNIDMAGLGIWCGFLGFVAAVLGSYVITSITRHPTLYFMICAMISAICGIMVLTIAVFKFILSLDFERGELCLCYLCITKLSMCLFQMVICLVQIVSAISSAVSYKTTYSTNGVRDSILL